MKRTLIKDNRGTTLVELILYITISAIILVDLSGILQQVVYNQTRIQVIARENENARALLRDITQNVEETSNISNPNSVNATSNSLTLIDINNNTVQYTFSNGVIYKQIGSNQIFPLSSQDIYVKNVVYEVESEAGISPSINIKLDIQQSSTNSTNATHYETTAAQRQQ